MARIFICDDVEYPDPDTAVSPEKFKEMMTAFLPEMATADMTVEKRGEDTVYCYKRKVGTKG